ncbi:SET and MYND domain-containing protein 4-like [Copidosoma floridanum]|uniref:SET and MYND domain-containing protein 4-like n=1 Tax=Copidosoma floridanum TaxID=29053 RepID=UPI0006C97CB5|nr:SET and MYND domain-containing protein 4-like [Copidosoma floridanum]
MAHDKETHSRILSLYTQSAALAESGSEELALAYCNRSALLLHLKRYEECMVDIQMATQITKSEQLKAKLEVRRVHCLAMGKGSKREKSSGQCRKIPLEARMKASKNIPCASESIAISFNEKYGWHIIAEQDIEPGTVIAVEKALASIPEKSCMYLNCTHCLNMAWNGIPCDSCTAAVFCSENCKKEALLQYHDVECSLLPLLCADSLGHNYVIRVAVRIYIIAIKKEGLAHILEVASNLKNSEDTRVKKFPYNNVFRSHTIESMYNLLETENYSNFEESLFDYSYSHYLPREEVDEASENKNLGSIITSFCSLFNHNCCNNVERLFTCNTEIVLFTSRSVKKGEQLFINYGTDIFTENLKQRSSLEKKYDFVCDCRACKEDWNKKAVHKSCQQVAIEVSKKLESAGLQYHTLEIFSNQSPPNVIISEKILKDIVKATKIIEKHCSPMMIDEFDDEGSGRGGATVELQFRRSPRLSCIRRGLYLLGVYISAL